MFALLILLSATTTKVFKKPGNSKPAAGDSKPAAGNSKPAASSSEKSLFRHVKMTYAKFKEVIGKIKIKIKGMFKNKPPTIKETTILGGKALIYSNGKDTKTAHIFSHGQWDDASKKIMKPIDGLTLKYFAPDTCMLNFYPDLLNYEPKFNPQIPQWKNYDLETIPFGEIGHPNEDEYTKHLNIIALGMNNDLIRIMMNTTTEELLTELKKQGYTTVKALHCRINKSVPKAEEDNYAYSRSEYADDMSTNCK